MKKRGVVIADTCNVKLFDQKITVECPPLDSALIKAAALYWDRIDIPDGRTFKYELPKEFNILSEEKILSRTISNSMTPGGFARFVSFASERNVSFHFSKDIHENGNNSAFFSAINESPIWVFEKLVKDKDVLWSYFQEGAVPVISNTQSRSLLFEIHQALPVPSSNTSIDDILEFKTKRSDELIALRHEIDVLYQKISQAEDIEHAKTMGFDSLNSTLKNLYKVTEESLVCKVRRSLAFEINIIGMASAMAALTTSVPISVGIGFLSCFKLDFGSILEERNSPYKYLLDARKNLKIN